ncbi:hypothetical protein [Tautonia rosea]|uniref:hypothetical protein n=1 Tax=Tautonia rosea TaxID=2728037 RepID=UPI001474FAFC|nr:hypothetical protein [Tautonia rosea]
MTDQRRKHAPLSMLQTPMIAWMALALIAVHPAVASDDASEARTETFTGSVLRLTEAIEPLGVTSPQGPIADQVVLRNAEGTIWPLLYNVGSRAFFEDDRLRDRPAELVARRIEGLPYLQVLSAKIADEQGVLRTPEYYCDICTISVRFDQPCPCCQAPMELRFKPED